ncbi:hypothetical protein Q0Z83_090050 [Actinoplanes sichuanensis]|uniref:Ig-like domain repeat protein n=1 Tax=Actinoplanes sichuanensis TaxID=512349 RepID=A0ABW4AKS7_9ACTN|nr:hypothetical protein [Actinoplanes sichuanensis]BEL10814.1 hypothetical protein Q0Z83_090050 [Actinoplanes sichuanensis]
MGNKRIGAAALALLTVGIAAPASADELRQRLSISSAGDLVVDGVHDRVFISDPAGGKVIATDYSGNQLGVASVTGATSLALAPDASRLYVSTRNGSAVLALDTTTLATNATFATGDAKPYDVVVAGGRIWFSYADTGVSKLGTIDPSTETVLLDRYDTGSGAAELATTAAKPDRIAVAAKGRIAVLDASGDTFTEVAATNGAGEIADVALSPDGRKVGVADRSDRGIRVRDVSDLATSTLWEYQTTPNSVDFASDGSLVGGDGGYSSNLFTFAPSGQKIKVISAPDVGDGQQRAAAWEPDGDRLFAVSASNGALTFTVYTDAKRSITMTGLGGATTVVPGASITLTGHVNSLLPLPTGSTVTITRDGTSLGAAEVRADRSFSITDTPSTEGTAIYRAAYAGDDFHLPSVQAHSVYVAKAVTDLTLPFTTPTVLPGGEASFGGWLTSWSPLPTGVTVAVSRNGTSLGSVTVDTNGEFRFADTPPAVEGTVTYAFSYAGDATHRPATATTSVQVSRSASTVTLAGPSSATRAKALTLTGTLASPLGLPAGATVSISRTDLDSPTGKALGTTTVDANGAFSYIDTPSAGGTVTYRASYAGDATRGPAAAITTVAVSRVTPSMAINNHGKQYAYNQTVTFTAYLGTTYKNRTVEIWADPYGSDQARRLVKRATVNSAGKVTASFKLTRNTTFSAVFTGDARYASRTVTATVGTKANLSLRLANNFKTKRISGTTYRVFRVSKYAYFTHSVSNAANRQVLVQLQRYSGGKWKNYDQRYFDATDLLLMSGSGLNGAKFRIRSAYVYSTSGDILNATTWTSYQYFTFSK